MMIIFRYLFFPEKKFQKVLTLKYFQDTKMPIKNNDEQLVSIFKQNSATFAFKFNTSNLFMHTIECN